MIINIFCDASIDLNRHIACGGCYIASQNNDGTISELDHHLVLQENATNNSSEILAIWSGVVKAINLRNVYPNAVFRLFSDSKISLYGLRDWLKNWVTRINDEGILISSSGQPVMNQQRFVDIFNLIVENDLNIELYHQRGHVKDGRVSLDRARIQFIRANKVPPEGLGLDIDYLSCCNDKIDNLTRNAVRLYIATGTMLPGTDIERVIPMTYMIRKNMIHKYIRCINKTSIVSRHDFKGGYNQ